MDIIKLSEVKNCSPTVMWFYDKFRSQIADIKTVKHRNEILSNMEEQFRVCILHEPSVRNDLSETYQLLKRKCMEA